MIENRVISRGECTAHAVMVMVKIKDMKKVKSGNTALTHGFGRNWLHESLPCLLAAAG